MSEIISRISLLSGWSSMDKVTVRHPDGSEWLRTLEYHGDAAAVLPFDPDRKTCLLVTMPRIAVLAVNEPALLEAPAGMLDDDELPEAAARREALEEAGVRLSELELVARIWTMPGLSTERVSIFLARYASRDRIGEGGGSALENEQIITVELSLARLLELVKNGALLDGKTLIAAQSLILRRPDLFY